MAKNAIPMHSLSLRRDLPHISGGSAALGALPMSCFCQEEKLVPQHECLYNTSLFIQSPFPPHHHPWKAVGGNHSNSSLLQFYACRIPCQKALVSIRAAGHAPCHHRLFCCGFLSAWHRHTQLLLIISVPSLPAATSQPCHGPRLF